MALIYVIFGVGLLLCGLVILLNADFGNIEPAATTAEPESGQGYPVIIGCEVRDTGRFSRLLKRESPQNKKEKETV